MTEIDWATGLEGDTGVTEMDGVTGSLYLGDPRVDYIPSDLVLFFTQRITYSVFLMI